MVSFLNNSPCPVMCLSVLTQHFGIAEYDCIIILTGWERHMHTKYIFYNAVLCNPHYRKLLFLYLYDSLMHSLNIPRSHSSFLQ